MAKKTKVTDEQMPARFPRGTFARIDAVRKHKESRARFVRVEVERGIRRRERSK